MTGNEIKRGALFLGGSVTVGLVLALLAVVLWPGLLGREAADRPGSEAPRAMTAQPAAATPAQPP